MICQQCKNEGLASIIYVGPTSVTCMAASTYYDENGDFHHNNPNYSITSYKCSNGHQWQEKSTANKK